MSTKPALLADIQSLFNSYDISANHKKKLFEWVWYSGIIAGVIAVVIFALITLYKPSFEKTWGGLILPIAEVVLIVYSFITLSYWAPILKRNFINARRSAEILRIHELFGRNGVTLKPSGFDLKEHIIPPDIVFVENSMLQTNHQPGKSEVLEDLKAFIQGQNKYHTTGRIEKFLRREHLLEKALKIILWSFLIIILLKLTVELLKYWEVDYFAGIKLKNALYLFKFSVICLPPVYAALEGFYYFSEWKRNIQVSKGVSEKYQILTDEIEEVLKHQQVSPTNVEELANKLYLLFHEENQNWYRWYTSKKIDARI